MSAKQSNTRTRPLQISRNIGPDRPLITGGLDWTWAFVIYRDIADWPGYKIGSDGSVWSRRKAGSSTVLLDSWHPHGIFASRRGYLYTIFHNNGARLHRRIHQLVLEAFVGPRRPGYDACHNDNNPGNNRLANLRYDTKSGNVNDKIRHGTMPFGSRSPRAKLNETKVREIKRRLSLPAASKRAIARAFGVSKTTVQFIAQGRTWRHPLTE